MNRTLRYGAWLCVGCVLTAAVLAPLGCGSSEPAKPPASPAAAGSPQEPSPESGAVGADQSQSTAEESSATPPGAAALPVVPAGLPPVPVPADNPMTAEKVALGRMLYFDKRLSKDGTISCATCHDPTMAWTEHKATSEGIGGKFGQRNSPTVINAAYAPAQFWDGRAASLEEQALGPIENPIEMGHSLPAMIDDLSKIGAYKEQFKKAFGPDAEITAENIGKAIAAFERTVLSGDSPYDRYAAGDKTAMSEAAQRGWETFQDAGCSTCHVAPLFSNFDYYNAGIGMDKPEPDLGRMDVTKKESDRGKFRVPPLREVANTHPYFHDGSVEKLEDAVALMASGGKDNPNLSVMLEAVRRKNLSAEQQADIVEFLKALSGKFPVVEPPALP